MRGICIAPRKQIESASDVFISHCACFLLTLLTGNLACRAMWRYCVKRSMHCAWRWRSLAQKRPDQARLHLWRHLARRHQRRGSVLVWRKQQAAHYSSVIFGISSCCSEPLAWVAGGADAAAHPVKISCTLLCKKYWSRQVSFFKYLARIGPTGLCTSACKSARGGCWLCCWFRPDLPSLQDLWAPNDSLTEILLGIDL